MLLFVILMFICHIVVSFGIDKIDHLFHFLYAGVWNAQMVTTLTTRSVKLVQKVCPVLLHEET